MATPRWKEVDLPDELLFRCAAQPERPAEVSVFVVSPEGACPDEVAALLEGLRGDRLQFEVLLLDAPAPREELGSLCSQIAMHSGATGARGSGPSSAAGAGGRKRRAAAAATTVAAASPTTGTAAARGAAARRTRCRRRFPRRSFSSSSWSTAAAWPRRSSAAGSAAPARCRGAPSCWRGTGHELVRGVASGLAFRASEDRNKLCTSLNGREATTIFTIDCILN